MKKVLSLVLTLVMCLSLCACGNNGKEVSDQKQSEEITLTTENVENYLSINTNVLDCDITQDKGSVLGLYYKNYEGEAEIEIDVVNRSDATFLDVVIECEVYTYVTCESGDAWYGWEFDYGNVNSGGKTHSDTNRKRITITLPSDGNWYRTEDLTFEAYDDQINFLFGPSELTVCGIDIISVTGTVKT